MSDHMKRLAAPRTWPLKRKVSVWATKQSPGAHSVESSMPAVLILRDMIGVCDTAREAKRIIGNRELIVDGKAVKNPKAPVGVMDTIVIPKMGLAFRMLLSEKGKFILVPISADEAKVKLCRIEDKTTVKDGKFQINLSGGRNIILDKNDYKVGDTLKIEVPDQKVIEHYPAKSGAKVLIVKGSQSGKIKTVKDLIVVKGSGENIVVFDDGTETTNCNIFVVGERKVEITMPEASA
ncbi:MAG: 30S ribosomal protein S4e [Candidatus Methanogranum gryphiswaldense]|nr:MAG: 30S ribosomal protein S4e [Candidatus Methanogranum sp. U3.2.1]